MQHTPSHDLPCGRASAPPSPRQSVTKLARMSSAASQRPRSITTGGRGYMAVMTNFHSRAAEGANAVASSGIPSSVPSRPNTRQTKRDGLLKEVSSDGCRDVVSLTMSFLFLCESTAFSLHPHHPHRNHIFHSFYIYSRIVGPEISHPRSGLLLPRLNSS